MESDTSFDSSDSEYDDKEIDEQQPKESIASLLELDNKEERPTALEEAIEAAKNVPAIQLRQEEEHDEMKLKLLKSNREGDLSDDVAKVKECNIFDPFTVPVGFLTNALQAFLCFCGPSSGSTGSSTKASRLWRRTSHYGSHSK